MVANFGNCGWFHFKMKELLSEGIFGSEVELEIGRIEEW